MGHGRKPPNPQKAPRGNGRRPPSPPPHSNSGKGACSLWVPAIPFVALFLLVRAGLRKAVKGDKS